MLKICVVITHFKMLSLIAELKNYQYTIQTSILNNGNSARSQDLWLDKKRAKLLRP